MKKAEAQRETISGLTRAARCLFMLELMTKHTSKSNQKEKRDDRAPESEPVTNEETAPEEPKATEPPAQEEALSDRFIRLQADFANYRKRVQRERSETYQRAAEDIFGDFLPVVDHFELGLAEARKHKADESIVNGLQLVYDEWLNLLKKYGVEVIAAEGETFDPYVHECISHLPSEEHPQDVIMTETRRGYRLGDRILRASQVVVSSGPAEAEEAAEPTEETS